MCQEIAFPAAIAGDRPAAGDVKLGALAIELGLGEVAAVLELPRIAQAVTEHEGDEGHGGVLGIMISGCWGERFAATVVPLTGSSSSPILPP